MSSLVQRSRPGVARRPDPTSQHWSMLLFESLSAGVLTIFIVFALVLIAVGVYGVVVWPLTFWDLANLGLEEYGSWVEHRIVVALRRRLACRILRLRRRRLQTQAESSHSGAFPSGSI